jgi:DNA-binding GntR family transcriptional regulator
MTTSPEFAGPRRLSDQIASYLRGEIYSGRLRPGERLYEVELCERLNVSRAPLREAILTLRTDGLVDVRPNRGALVTPFSDDDIREIFTLRHLLEPIGARVAAERANERDLRVIGERFDEMKSASERGEALPLALAHASLHTAIANASGMPRLATFVDVLCTQMLASHATGYAADSTTTESILTDHEPIVAAVRGGHADEAERCMRSHFRPVEPIVEAYQRLRDARIAASTIEPNVSS